MESKIIDNIRQQTNRLVSQLQQLQENKESLTLQQYTDMKTSTLEDLKTFQTFLVNMKKGDKVLDSQIQKSKELIMKTCKQTFNKEQITKNLLTAQVKQIRNQIKQVEKSYQIKQINQETYIMTKRRLIMQVQQTGLKLQTEEEQWLDVNNFDDNKGMKKQIAQKHMGVAQKNIHKLDK